VSRQRRAKTDGERTQEVVDALRHVKRRQVLRLMIDRKEPISPAQASRELEVHLSSLSYHFRVLCDAGLLTLVSQRPKRGAIEHFYAVESVALEQPMVKALLEAP
jgi:DNA-binding transcriptional ArsR family regulator